MTKHVLANYDDHGVWVYQAFKPSIVAFAVENGTFGKGFGMERMTWIKPSFGWILHRSGCATKHRQEAIARIKITHEGFVEILAQSIATSYENKHAVHESEALWRRALSSGEVRHQWDPDRDMNGRKLERRAIQIGIKGSVVQSYVSRYILEVQDATTQAHAIRNARMSDAAIPAPFVERAYPLDASIERRLGCS